MQAIPLRSLSGLAWILLVSCAPAPYAKFDGEVFARLEAATPAVDTVGLHVPVAVGCWIPTTVRWCRPTEPACRPEPNVTTYRRAECPQTLVPAAFSLRAPWGTEYHGKASLSPAPGEGLEPPGSNQTSQRSKQSDLPVPDIFKGVLTAKIDWSTTGLGPKDLPNSSKLSGWSVISPDTNLTTPLELSGADLKKVIAMITESIAARADSTANHQGEHADLAIGLSSEFDSASGTNQVYVTVTNRGPNPAYKVIAQLKSSSKYIHGNQLTVERIAVGKTERLSKQLPPVEPGADHDPMVHAVVTALNAPSVSVDSRLHLVTPKPAPPLQLLCATVEKSGAPGQKLRIQCTATNPSDVSTRITSVEVAVGSNGALPASGAALPDLAAHGNVPFEVTPTLPRDAKPGSAVPLTIKLSSEDFSPVQQEITVRVFQAGMCTQLKLTREQYEAKHKRLQALFDAGALTQDEFDHHEAEAIACLE